VLKVRGIPLSERIPTLFLAWQAIAPVGAAVNSQGREPLAWIKRTHSPVRQRREGLFSVKIGVFKNYEI